LNTPDRIDDAIREVDFEQHDADQGYHYPPQHCTTCNQANPADKERKIYAAPEYFLGRLQVNAANPQSVDIPTILDLSPYQHSDTEGSPLKYKLSSVTYQDTANPGHYMSSVRGRGGRISLINDHNVQHIQGSKLATEHRLRQNPQTFNSLTTYYACMVAYTRIRPRGI
jgi:ubiquitin C-terminal hydrolase